MIKSNYETLGISDDASKVQIRIAFRELALKHHSDRGGDDEYFIKIKQAFEDLKTGKKFPDSSEEKEKKSKFFWGTDEEEKKRRDNEAVKAGEIPSYDAKSTDSTTVTTADTADTTADTTANPTTDSTTHTATNSAAYRETVRVQREWKHCRCWLFGDTN